MDLNYTETSYRGIVVHAEYRDDKLPPIAMGKLGASRPSWHNNWEKVLPAYNTKVRELLAA